MKNYSIKAILATLAIGGCTMGYASAYTETNAAYTPGQSFGAFNSNDLLVGSSPTSNTNVSPVNGDGSTTYYAGNVAALTDGSFGIPGPGDAGNTGSTAYNFAQEYYITDYDGASYTPVITFSLGSNALGYNVTGLQTATSWIDAGRVDQNYTVSFSIDGGLTYGNAITVAYDPAQGGAGSTTGELVNLTNLGLTGTGLTGVTNVEYTFTAGTIENDGVGYDELAVDGTPVTLVAPEPTTTALLLASLVGGVALLVRRNKTSNA